MALILPSTAALKKHDSNLAYPFAAKHYGAGSDFYARQAAASFHDPTQEKSGTGWTEDLKSAVDKFAVMPRGSMVAKPAVMPFTGYGSNFYGNQAAAKFPPTDSEKSGTGYQGPTGWVNTQPHTGRRELKNLKTDDAGVAGPDGAKFWIKPDHESLRDKQRLSDARSGTVRIKGQRSMKRGRNRSALHKVRGGSWLTDGIDVIGKIAGLGEKKDHIQALFARARAALAK